MTIYLGTDRKTAIDIMKNKSISAESEHAGPMVSTTVEDAIRIALDKCDKFRLGSSNAAVVIIENVPSLVFNTATKAEGETIDTFHLNDEFRKPMQKFNFQMAHVMPVHEARNWKFFYPKKELQAI